MQEQNGTNIYTKLSNKYNLPYQTIRLICNHPFLFANRVISSGDERPLMFTYLGKIKIKKKYATHKDNKELNKS